MGTYTKSSITPASANDGRPIYEKGKHYLYYLKGDLTWNIGDSYTSDYVYIDADASSAAGCPHYAKKLESLGWS